MSSEGSKSELRDWFYRDFSRGSPVAGPFTLDELAERVQTGEIAHDTLVRYGEEEWLQADRVIKLTQAIRNRRPAINTAPEFAPPEGSRAAPHRRRLNWWNLFVQSVLLTIVGLLLLGLGQAFLGYNRSTPLSLLGGALTLVGIVVNTIAGVVFTCAIIRWAIEPLFGQMVDTNDHLASIAKLLKQDKSND